MTAGGKITTARLTPGSRILVRRTLATSSRGVDVLVDTNRPDRPGNVVATVQSVSVVSGPGRRRTIVTDLGEMDSTAAASHWPATEATS